MLTLSAKEEINCSLSKLMSDFKNLDKIYTKYCPEEHLISKYLKGNPTIPGSILYFEEFIADKKHKLKYKVDSVTDNKVVFKAMFPRSIFNIKVTFLIQNLNERIVLERNITIGNKSPVLNKLLDNIILTVLGKNYYNELVKHNKDDLEKLKLFIEKQTC